MAKRKNKSSRRKKGGVKGEGAGGDGEKKDKSNRRKKGGVKGHGAGEGGEKNEVEKMVKQKHYCNQRTSSLEPDPLQDNQQLAYQLEVLGGLCVKEVEGDGNCCFRSLSDQLYGFPSKYNEVRADVVDFLEQNKADFIPFIEDDEKWEDYISRMRTNAEWGGHMELVAASRCYECSIVLHQPGKPRLEIRNGSKELHISYLGELHYNSVRLSGNFIGPPKPIKVMETTTSPPCPVLASNSSNKNTTVHLYSAKGVVRRSCPWATNHSIKAAIDLANGDALKAIEILLEGKEKKIPSKNTLLPAPGVTIPTSVGGRESKEEEGGNCFDEQIPSDEERHDIHCFKTERSTRGGPCPCGSGLVYKKCCKRNRKARNKRNGKMGGRNTTSTQDDDGGLRDSFERVIVL